MNYLVSFGTIQSIVGHRECLNTVACADGTGAAHRDDGLLIEREIVSRNK